MIQDFLRAAAADEPVYLSRVRAAFQQAGDRPLHLHVKLYGGETKRFTLLLPSCEPGREAAFVGAYVHATLYNILSSLGAARIDVYADPSDAALWELAGELETVFQLRTPKALRSGYGKSLNVNERTLLALGVENPFGFCRHDLKEEPAVAAQMAKIAGGEVFSKLPQQTAGRLLLGMDVGGTDIKMVAAWDGKLVAFKEYDWFPAGFSLAEQLTGPMVLLTRLLRAAASLAACGKAGEIDLASLDKTAADAQMEQAAARMEQRAGDALRNFDAIGLCFPDVVVQNRIVGGETYKTRGLRANRDVDYESQFAKITGLNELLAAFVTPDGAVCNTNDGPMAAFTAAVEQAAAGQDMSEGFFAHTLGTELGTGWVLPDGTIPEIPLEVYNFIIDLGSGPQQEFDPDDVRSVRNFNTGLPGTLQKYTCQSGVFRLAAKWLPDAAPQLYREILDKGLFVRQGEKLVVPTAPTDMRKACLEFFMAKAAEGDSNCRGIFRQVGEYLGQTYLETQFVLQTGTQARTLFGRLIKNDACFRLLCEGASAVAPELRQYAADGTLANTPLMRQLEDHPSYTVAQFAQAVGAVYYGCTGL